ncbi:MAG: hypothetical protein IGS48_16140 [Oscillatoriales cyanobacterium C42_A2020_001]|nr:hypothetical protein [Leptolyngbyaceae cyanobacterium C42_A2020_001]
MWGKSTKDTKLRGILALVAGVGAAALFAGMWLAVGRLPSKMSSTSTIPSLSGSQDAVVEFQQPAAIASPSTDLALAQESNTSQPAPANAGQQGRLRVGNSTEHPVRVALLLKKPGTAKNKDATPPGYENPAHWDFDPGEGSIKGLVLSLPNRPLKLKKGDILVAFAQDGSRRYWGPYVVGETSSPVWSANAAEWELVLRP